QANVRTFRRLDRAHAAVVRRVNISNLDSRAVSRKTTGAKRRKTALVCEAGERVVLIHERRKLRRAKELFNRCQNGSRIDESVRVDRFNILCGHALAHDTLHAAESGADLVLDQLAHRTNTTVAE